MLGLGNLNPDRIEIERENQKGEEEKSQQAMAGIIQKIQDKLHGGDEHKEQEKHSAEVKHNAELKHNAEAQHHSGDVHYPEGEKHKEGIVEKIKEKIHGGENENKVHGGEKEKKDKKDKKKKKDKKDGEHHGHKSSSSDSD